MAQAACKGQETDVFYPKANRYAYDKAKALCAGCPVRQDCLDLALANMFSDPDDETVIPIGWHGMWGGTTPDERRAMVGIPWAIELLAERAS